MFDRHKHYLKNRTKYIICSTNYYANNKKWCSIRQKEYRTKNREKVLAQKREYYRKNKEICLAKCKEYNQKNREKIKIRVKKYNIKNKAKIKIQKRIYQLKNREKFNALQRKYNKEKPHLRKARQQRYFAKKYASNENFVKMYRLRALFNQTFKRYSKTGKAYNSKKYGVNFQAICEHLGECPGDRKKYRIHHIKPLNSFNFDDPEQVKEAFAPENHKWVTIKEHEIIHNSKFV